VFIHRVDVIDELCYALWMSYFSFCSYGGVRSWHCFVFCLRCCYLFFGVLKWKSYQHFPVLLFFVWGLWGLQLQQEIRSTRKLQWIYGWEVRMTVVMAAVG